MRKHSSQQTENVKITNYFKYRNLEYDSKKETYSVIEEFVFSIEETYNVTIMAIGYDRYNALSSAQKWDKKKLNQK